MNQFLKTQSEIKSWLEKLSIFNYTIHDDLTVDVNGDVSLFSKNLTYIPVQFGIVSGFFDCSENQLTSLLGSPTEIGKSFFCSKNRLTSLEYLPAIVEKDIIASNNQIRSLKKTYLIRSETLCVQLNPLLSPISFNTIKTINTNRLIVDSRFDNKIDSKFNLGKRAGPMTTDINFKAYKDFVKVMDEKKNFDKKFSSSNNNKNTNINNDSKKLKI